MTPKEFLKTDKATDFENVAFTAEQWNAVYAWMNDFLTHEGQSLPIQNVSQQSELLLQCYKEGFQAAVDSLVGANEAVKNKTLQ